nr:putative ORF1 [Marmot picobirnavirus]
MTQNQISYARLQEDRRHNIQTEKAGHVTAQAAKSQAESAAKRQTEDARHNVTTEGINWWANRETQRHNLAGESELQRHNIAGEGALNRQLSEGERHNKAVEETNAFTATAQARVGAANAEAALRQAAASERRAGSQEAQIDLGFQQLGESTRHNRYQESIADRQTTETQAARVASNSLERQKIAESARSNKARETENTRSHTVSENLARTQSDRDYYVNLGRLRNEENRTLISAISSATELAKSIVGVIGGLS